jgi:MFS superfamily sulfate permease-like transporter
MGVFRLEIITTYFSDAVVGGFSTGAAFHVFVTQLKDFFGLKNVKQHSGAFNLFYVSQIWALDQLNLSNFRSWSTFANKFPNLPIL